MLFSYAISLPLGFVLSVTGIWGLATHNGVLIFTSGSAAAIELPTVLTMLVSGGLVGTVQWYILRRYVLCADLRLKEVLLSGFGTSLGWGLGLIATLASATMPVWARGSLLGIAVGITTGLLVFGVNWPKALPHSERWV